MNEQKYYVQINKKLWNNLNPLQLGGVGIDLCPSDYDYGQYFIAEYEPESIYAKVNKNSFTKLELSKIMDGVLYKQSDYLPFQWLYSFGQLRDEFGWKYNETIDKWEWINPLIEIVPAEEN